MIVELEQDIPIDAQKKCADYNRFPSTNEDFCTKDKNCKYSAEFDECTGKITKKVNKPYVMPKILDISRTLETKNLEYTVNDNNTKLTVTTEHIHCIDWQNIIQISSRNRFHVNKTDNSITFIGDKCQEFVETISPKTLDGEILSKHIWALFPSVEAPTIENNTLKFHINESQFQGCEQNIELHITCYINDIAYKLGPFNGTRIDTKSLQDEAFEKCFAVAYMHDSKFKQLYKNKRKPSDFFQPSGKIYGDGGTMNLAIIIPSSVGGAIVGLVIMGNIH